MRSTKTLRKSSSKRQSGKVISPLFEKISNIDFCDTLDSRGALIRNVEVPKRILSANKFLTQHWRRYWAYKKGWQKVLGLIFRSPGPGYLKPEKAIVRITSWRKRTLDYDNLVAGCKPIVDFLKIAGWIVDDCPQHVELIVEQRGSNEDKTTIELFEGRARQQSSGIAGADRLRSTSSRTRSDRGISSPGGQT